MEIWRKIIGRRQESNPQVGETLQLPSGMPLEVVIAQKVPEMERRLQHAATNRDPKANSELSLPQLVNFFGLQTATSARSSAVTGNTASTNFDFTIEERLGTTAMRATRVVKASEEMALFPKGKSTADIPANIVVSTRLMTAKTADQAEIFPGDNIGDEAAEIIVIAQWATPQLLPKIGIAYTGLYLRIDRKVMYSSQRYGAVWEVFIDPEGIYVGISPRRQEGTHQLFTLDFNGKYKDPWRRL